MDNLTKVRRQLEHVTERILEEYFEAMGIVDPSKITGLSTQHVRGTMYTLYMHDKKKILHTNLEWNVMGGWQATITKCWKN